MADDRDNQYDDEMEENQDDAQLPEPIDPYPDEDDDDDEMDEEFDEDDDEDDEDDEDDGSLDEAQEQEFEAFEENEDDEDLEISDESSYLASSPGRNIMMLVGIVVVSAVALYFILFSGGDEEQANEAEPTQTVDPKNVREATQNTFIDEPDVGVIAAPTAPNISDIEAPEQLPFEENEPEEPAIDSDIDIPFDTSPPDFFDTPAPVVNIPEPEEADELPDSPQLPDELGDLPPAPGLEPIPGGPSIKTPEQQAAEDARRRSGIMLLNGGGSSGEGGDVLGGLLGGGGGTAAVAQDPNVLQQTTAAQSFATSIGNTNSIVAQGKMIDAVLETAINTDLPGVLRAIVSRDIYAESGKKILIPKGSRLIGNYEAELESGQKRVFVVWTRIIRPDGIDVIIDSPGVDTLGRAGVAGIVDTRFMEIFGNAVLLSALTVTGAYALETITGATETTNSTTTSPDGSTSSSSTGTPTSFAISEAATSLSDTASDIVADTVNNEPRIAVPQGTRIKVFVNSDLIFPSSVSQKVRFIN